MLLVRFSDKCMGVVYRKVDHEECKNVYFYCNE